MYPTKKLLHDAEEDFYKAWDESAKLIKKKGESYKFPERRGESHVLYDYAERVRQILLNLGFDEVIHKPFWEDTHVKLQYGPEAPAILDRLYYAASLPRPDIGISKEKEAELKKLGNIDVKVLKDIFKDYKRGEIDPGDLFEELITKLKIDTSIAAKIISLFPEMESLQPISSNMTLLSHFTTAWFPTIANMLKRSDLPLQLFTNGWRFRREQKEDSTHLKAHYNTSIVVVDKDLSIEDAESITRKVMSALGFDNVKLIYKKHNPIYYAPGTNFEVFTEGPNGKLIEVADGGLYSPISLAKYGIPYSVFNLGPSLHRTVMIKEGFSDVRHFTYPHEYEAAKLTDSELANMLYYDVVPISKDGHKLADIIEDAAKNNRDKTAPVSVTAYEGTFMTKTIKVEVFEPDNDAKLLGKAALNKVYVHNGSVYGLPDEDFNEKVKDIREKGVKTNISFLQGVIYAFVKALEEGINEDKKNVELRVRMAKRPSELNIGVKGAAKYYITSNKTLLQLKGPVFIGLKAEIK
ncbi:O-phosphoserine--tRNA(Cys) ligase [Candidatus Tiddalikarchaeum anstoanum]|nr:O-phosphoserine--tRNA(Cys) ligase [Candidatus Tiddalikarchaeum anstoanum]